jgi:Na+/H+-dicarboxylate symporter/ABC-type amino acid transport substrate-binding protein
MTVLPYISLALIVNIGRLSPAEGKRFGAYAGAFLLFSLLVTLGAIVLLPLCLPEMESASFFSTGTLADPVRVDFVKLFIPSNPFHSLANNVVPAVVLFCIAVGVAAMTLPNKKSLLEQLDLLTAALARINQYLVKLTPIGVFAIVASIAGTMQVEELARLKAYLVMNAVASLVLGFGVLMPLLAALTPFSYRELFSVSRAPVLTAFVTGKVFIVLPMLVESAEELFKRHFPEPEGAVSHVRAVTPLIYPFPHAGKLLALLFVPFAAWYIDVPLSQGQYPAFLGAGLFGLFGSPMAAIPFLLDMLQLPADMFQLFIASGIFAGRLGDLLGAVHLLFVSVLTAAALNGAIRFQPRKLLITVGLIIVLGGAAMGATRAYLGASLESEYNKDTIVRNMHSALHSSPAVVHKSVPTISETQEAPVLQRISEGGVLRVGYHPDNLPVSFFNAADELVGYDIDMAHLLARQMGCRLEFVPFEFSTLADQLERGDFDVAMSGIGMLPRRLARMRFTEPYIHMTAAIIVRDHRREEFTQRMARGDFRGIRLAATRSGDVEKLGAAVLPGAEWVRVPSLRHFFESEGREADGLVFTAEGGSAWSLLYPHFSVVPIRPLYRVPGGYPVAQGNDEFMAFLSTWLETIKASSIDERLYDHWILGKDAEKRGPRWSVIRDVLHWVE